MLLEDSSATGIRGHQLCSHPLIQQLCFQEVILEKHETYTERSMKKAVHCGIIY